MPFLPDPQDTQDPQDAWFELESGLPQTGYRDRDGSAGEVLAVFQTALPHVSVALRGDHGENDGDGSRLRAI